MLKGVLIKKHNQLTDERGFFTELMRKDWEDFYKNEIPSQTNLIESYPYIIRAWHKNLKGQINYFTALEGAIKICVFDEKTHELTEIISTKENFQTVRVPAHYWHGFRVISMQPAKVLYKSTQRLKSNRSLNKTLERPYNNPQNNKQQKRSPQSRQTLELAPPTTQVINI